MFYKLSATILVASEEDVSRLKDNSLFIATYFQGVLKTRFGLELKYQSIVTVDTYHLIVKEIAEELLQQGVTEYSFNITPNYLLNSS